MEVRILKAGAKRKLASGAEQSYPVGWTGQVPDDVALVWAQARIADVVVVQGSQFTELQAAVLGAAADEIIAAHMAAAQQPVAESDPGEPADVPVGGKPPAVTPAAAQPPAATEVPAQTREHRLVVLNELEYGDLKELAKERGINHVGKSREALIDLLAGE